MALGRTVGELMRGMSSLEYTHWLELYGKEPIGPERGDYHAAQVATMLANVNRDPKRRIGPYRLSEFLLFRERDEETEEAELAARLRAAFPDTAKER